MNIPAPLWGWLIAGFLAYTSVGLGDLAIGLVYMFVLPKELGLSHSALLYDRCN